MTSIPHERHEHAEDDDGVEPATETLPRFPNWMRQLLGFGTLIATVTLAWGALKSDVRDQNTRLEQQVERAKASEQRQDRIEGRLNSISDDVVSIKSDMRYVRRAVESRGNP
jgi:hypothetical protein